MNTGQSEVNTWSPAFASTDDIRGNAFYCGGEDDDYIAYDAAN